MYTNILFGDDISYQTNNIPDIPPEKVVEYPGHVTVKSLYDRSSSCHITLRSETTSEYIHIKHQLSFTHIRHL